MRARLVFAALCAIALVAVACSKGTSIPPPEVQGNVGFDQNQAVLADDLPQKADPFFACGSETAAFGTEILTTRPDQAKVGNEWGDVVPGKEVFATGEASTVKVGHGGDLPFTHPFGDDLTFTVKLDGPFANLAQTLGTQEPPLPEGNLHVEIAEGMIPHQEGATFAGGGFLEGFIPQDGDRVALYGHWIIDCGHADFHTEIHPIVLMAFAHDDGSKTDVHVFYNPYYETQVYTPLQDKVADFAHPTRVSDPGSARFPQYLFQQLLRIGGLGPKGPLCCAERLAANMIIDVSRDPSLTWFACAPDRDGGGRVSFTSNFTVRPGVSIEATPDDPSGCVRFDATMGSDYEPFPIQPNDCVVTWETLNRQAGAALGQTGIDLRKGINEQVPASFRPKVNNDPHYSCFDPMVAPPLPTSGQGQHTTTSADQAFPFYGQITVTKG